MTATEAELAAWLMTAQAARHQCGLVLAAGLAGSLEHFSIDLNAMDTAVESVCQVTLQRYPHLDIPLHARWRHFVVAGEDRWATACAGFDLDARELARCECELAIVSVLLDAGAGPHWRYRDGRGHTLSRSEGLAIASLEAYLAGVFASRPDTPLHIDAKGLLAFTGERLAHAFQVSADNPLVGLEGRARLLQSLGRTVAARADLFGRNARLGAIADHLLDRADDGRLAAGDVLQVVLDALSPIWPGRLELAGRNLGDAWPHPAAGACAIVPFHKLSQWLAYSLIEPLERAGVRVSDLDELTGLAEYRNGGLFIDTGVLTLRDPQAAAGPHRPGDQLIVEWRALTLALLDRLADAVRARLGRDKEQLSLAAVLEGGAWAAGRKLANEARAGAPPIAIVSDGSVF